MAAFLYKAQDRKGNVVKGFKYSDNLYLLIREIEKEGLDVLKIRRVGLIELLYFRLASSIVQWMEGKSPSRAPLFTQSKLITAPLRLLRRFKKEEIGKGRISAFTKELSILLRAGVPVEQGLRVIANSEEPGSMFQQIINSLLVDIQTGVLLPVAFSKFAEEFPPEYTGLLNVGMETGRMPDVLETLARDLDRDDRLHKHVRSSLVYPVFILIIAILSNLGIFLFVFPQLADIVTTMKVNIPLCTRILLFAMGLVKNPLFLLTAGTIISLVLFQVRLYLDTPVGRYNLTAMSFGIPIIGHLSLILFSEKFCRAMGMLFLYNVPVNKSLKMVGEIFKNPYLDSVLFRTIYERVIAGEDLDIAMRNSPLIPKVVSNLVAVGGHTGDMAFSFNKAAEIYELEISQTIDRLVTLIEPFIVLVLGFFILFTMLSIFLPLYQAITALGS